MPPRAIEALALILKNAFGLAGLMLARKEQSDDNKAREDRRRLGSAIEELV